MVSPPKIFKTSNAGYKVGFVRSRTDCLKTQGGSRQRASSSQVKNSHPLANTRFYLDIRNKAQLAKVESALKSYGAKIELFFWKGVKVVVTDKSEWLGNGPSSATSISPVATPSPSSNQDQRFVVPKTRASAMIEKVSRQPASPYFSALDLAQKWKIPVFPVSGLWKWIAKIEEAFLVKVNEKRKESKIVADARDSPFIKIESSVSPNIPEFLVLESWPRLNLDGHLGQCPFRSSSPPSPSLSDEESKEVENKLFDVKDKVAVELIKYDTDFRIKDNLKIGECEEEDEEVDVSGKQESNFEGLNGRVASPVTGFLCTEKSCFLHRSSESVRNFGEGLRVLTHCNMSSFFCIFRERSKMTRRPAKSNALNNEEETTANTETRQNVSPLCNGYGSRNITRQSSHELLKVQCNGLTTSHRNSKLLSPSGSDVLPLPTSRRTTRRASASWCGSTRELSQLSPTDSEIENIRRSESSFEAHDSSLDSPGITLRPKGQLWLPVALIGTTAEENGNCIRKRYEYSLRQSENSKLSGDFLEAIDENTKEDLEEHTEMPRASKESDSSVNSNCSSPNEYQIKRNSDKKETYCIITRNTKTKNYEINGRSRESSVESHKSEQGQPKSRTECKKRSFSVCGRISPSVKRARTMSTNSVHSVGKKKKLSPEEKLLQDNKEYFKMEVLNTKLRSSGSLLNINHNKESEGNVENSKPQEKIDKIIIKKIKIKGGRKKKSRWAKSSSGKKGNDGVNYATIIVESKKNNVKINGVLKRKRQSELMKLCNEAETFMFGESSRQGSTTTNTTESELEYSPRKRNSRMGTQENSSHERGNCLKSGRKRRSHAEAFIHDNLDYYKFETPGSRLRYQGNLVDVKSEDKDFIYTLRQKRKERLSTEQNKKNELLERLQLTVEVKEERMESQEKKKNLFKPSEEIEKILFSFESIPKTEPWYAVYKRQDEGEENYYPLLSDPADQPFLLPYELPKPVYPKVPTVSEYYKRRRKKFVHLFNHPRKSPRCHASTLAILSSLKRRKRRSGTNISMNAMLSESPPANSSPLVEKSSTETDKNDTGSEEILESFFKSDSDVEDEEILLEPLSDSENKPKRKNSDSGKSVKSDDEDGKPLKTGGAGGGRSKKLTRLESQSECDSANDEEKHFSLETIQPDSFIKDMVIEIRKKSGLNVNIATMLEKFKNCRSMEESDAVFISDPGGGSGGDSQDNRKRKRKKARKINKTGWDNRKSRRRTGNKIAEVKEPESEAVTLKPNCVKKKVRNRQNYINSENIIPSTKKRARRGEEEKSSEAEEKKTSEKENEDKPVLRSHLETGDRLAIIRRVSQDSESLTESIDSASRDFPPCVVRVRKISNASLGPSVRVRCSKGRYSIQKRRLVLRRKKKRVIDYAWSTKRRR